MFNCNQNNEIDCHKFIKKSEKNKIKEIAKYYNNYGFKEYKKKNYKKAAKLFNCALEKNNNHILANYNLACVLSILYGKGEKVKIQKIIYYLRKSLQINGKISQKRFKKLKLDQDLNSIRNHKQYSKLINEIYLDRRIKKELQSYQRWVEVEPETIPWMYVFGSNRYAFFAGGINWVKENPLSENEIIIGEYFIRNNNIYFTNQKSSYTYLGYGKVKQVNAAGKDYYSKGYHFVEPAYRAHLKSHPYNNDKTIKELIKIKELKRKRKRKRKRKNTK